MAVHQNILRHGCKFWGIHIVCFVINMFGAPIGILVAIKNGKKFQDKKE